MTATTEFNPTNNTIIPVGTLDANGNPVGGLSGITYDAATNTYYAISDGRSTAANPGPARFYTLNLTVDPNTGNVGGVNVAGVTTIGNPPPFPTNTSDTEGIAFVTGNLYISSEGTFNGAAPITQPFINRFDLTGNQNLVLPVPSRFVATAGATGIRENRGFESLTVTPDGQFLVTATENALRQDGAAATATNGSPSRILRYNLTTGLPDGEFLYNTEVNSGVSELLALDNNTFLVIERPFALGIPVRLYEVSLLGATDISGFDSLPAGAAPVEKTLIGNLPFDNFEGMAFGPTLGDGRRSLIILSDNNFGAFGTGSQFAGFAIRINTAPTLTPLAPNLTGIVEDPITNNGDLVSSLIGNAIADPDPGTVSGIAVTAVDNTNGTWQYSTDGGLNWTDFGAVSAAATRLLAADANNRIRFVPTANYSGSSTITYQAWDGTRGTNGLTIDLSTADRVGGITAFSTASDTAAIAVNAVADAPILTVTPATGNINTAIPLNITTTLADIDGSETLSNITIANVPIGATLSAGTNDGNGNWTLTPTQLNGLTIAPAVGDETDFTLTVTATALEAANGNTASTSATLNVTVNNPATAPVATDDSATTDENINVAIAVLANDNDADGSLLSIASFDTNSANNGTVILDDNDTPNDATDDRLVYTPSVGFSGLDSFNYTITDGTQTDTATVTVTVNPGQPNPPQPFSLRSTPNNVFFIEGGTGQTQFKFTLTERETSLVNEIGVFVVNDDQGTIIDPITRNAITPGQNGYLQAALSKATVIFSALSEDEFDELSFTRQLSFNAGDRLGFYLIQDSTTDTLLANLAAGRTLPNIFFATSSANSDGFDHLQVSERGNSTFTLAWEDSLGGGDRDFNDLELTVELTNQPFPVGTGLQGLRERELIDLSAQVGQRSVNAVVNSDAAFDNFVGLYVVDNEQGTVNGIAPGQAGYAQAALQRRVLNLENEENLASLLNGGILLAPYIVADATVEEFLAENPNNQTGQGPLAYFAYLGANPDRLDHVRLLGDNTFGFEDVLGGGDRDFNDIVLQLNFA